MHEIQQLRKQLNLSLESYVGKTQILIKVAQIIQVLNIISVVIPHGRLQSHFR